MQPRAVAAVHVAALRTHERDGKTQKRLRPENSAIESLHDQRASGNVIHVPKAAQ